MTPHQFVETFQTVLQADGYSVLAAGLKTPNADTPSWHYVLRDGEGNELARGAPCPSQTEAWSSALLHRIELSQPMAQPATERPAMDAFAPATLPPWVFDPQSLAERCRISIDEARRQAATMANQRVFANQTYQVNVCAVPQPFGVESGDMAWLSIKRRDRAPIHDWRDLQVIKNQLIGEENEGFEIFPAESRLVDTANQYHVWVFLDSTVRLPVGFQHRKVAGTVEAAMIGAVQRDFPTA